MLIVRIVITNTYWTREMRIPILPYFLIGWAGWGLRAESTPSVCRGSKVHLVMDFLQFFKPVGRAGWQKCVFHPYLHPHIIALHQPSQEASHLLIPHSHPSRRSISALSASLAGETEHPGHITPSPPVGTSTVCEEGKVGSLHVPGWALWAIPL